MRYWHAYASAVILVAGAWGELNGAFNTCCDASWSGKSVAAAEAPTASAASHVRRHISIAVAKANAECLCKVLDNSGDHIDPEAAALASSAASRQQDLQRIYSEGHAAQEAYRTHYDYSHDFPNGPPRG